MPQRLKTGFLFVAVVGACVASFFVGTAIERGERTSEARPDDAEPVAVPAGASNTGAEATKPKRRSGNWKPARTRNVPEIDEGVAAQLTALGYMEGYESPRGAGGGYVHHPSQIYDGVTLLCSGHAPVAQLVSLDGKVVHEWTIPFDVAWPSGVPFPRKDRHTEFLRRAHVFPNGDLLALFDYIGIVKLDKDSNVLWETADEHHHDLMVTEDGTIITLARTRIPAFEARKMFPGYKVPIGGVWDDVVVFLDPAGNELRRVSILEAFLRSDYASFLPNRLRHQEPFHANSVQLIDRDLPQLGIEKGEVLISLRLVNAIVSLDPNEEKITWLLTGQWRGQHQATLLDNDNILLLDNLGGNRKEPFRRNQSQALEVDPRSQSIEWRFGSTPEAPLFTRFLGYVRRLPNGNTLITESAQGRILEVARDGRVVWEYLSPHRAGENDELVATVLGGQRIPRSELPFLAGGSADSPSPSDSP